MGKCCTRGRQRYIYNLTERELAGRKRIEDDEVGKGMVRSRH